MPERGRRRKEASHQHESILSEIFVQQILHDAKTYLRQYDGLPPTLFAQLDNGENLYMPLALPQTHEEKRVYFDVLGTSLLSFGKKLHEAMLIAESWYVEKTKENPTLTVLPSQHPNRKEAISVVGRNALGSQSIFALQPFGRDARRRPVFEPLQIKEISGDFPTAFYFVGLLDYLFTGNQKVLH